MDVGNFYRCRLQISRNFGSVILANFLPTRVPVCLLNNAKSPVGMTDLEIKRTFGALAIFTVADFKFWRISLVNISVGMIHWTLQTPPPGHFLRKTAKKEDPKKVPCEVLLFGRYVFAAMNGSKQCLC